MLPVKHRDPATLSTHFTHDEDDVDLDALLDAKLEELDEEERTAVPLAAPIPIPDQGPELQEIQQLLKSAITDMIQRCDMHVKHPHHLREGIQQEMLKLLPSTKDNEKAKQLINNKFSVEERDQMEKFMRANDVEGAMNLISKLEMEGRIKEEDFVNISSQSTEPTTHEVSDELIQYRIGLLKRLGLEEEFHKEIASHPDFDIEIYVAKIEFLNQHRDQIPILCTWAIKNATEVVDILVKLDPRMMVASDWYLMEKCLKADILDKGKRIGVEWLKKHCLGSK